MGTYIPWGFIDTGKSGLTATESTKDRARRAQLGETAIYLLGRLDVTVDMLETLADIQDEGGDPFARLEELMKGG